LTGLDLRDEAQAIEPIIERHCEIGDLRMVGRSMPSHQRQSQESVRDGGTDRQLALRALDVHMNELMIVGALGKFIDAILIDGEPFGRSELLANPGLEFLKSDSLRHGLTSRKPGVSS